MSNKLYEESAIQDIANAIRSKSGTSDTFKVAEMGDAVRAIPQGGVTPTGTINITSNGTHDVTQYASASVNVPTSEPSGNITITANGTGIDVANYATATVAVPGPSGSQTYTQNGTYDVSAIAEAVINVSGGGGNIPDGLMVGEFTLEEDLLSGTYHTISADLGSNPLCLVCLRENTTGFTGNATLMAYWLYGVTNQITQINAQGTIAYNATACISDVTATGFKVTARTNYPMRAGRYVWMAFKSTTTT